ncbi:MAG TPA: AAA family ATPase [Micromonosporaceae bacterium]|jgi:predicted kinase|nr:AAA family ATPase [Micromonosporaceae bacterium]
MGGTVLIVMSGLPGAGKSAIADAVGRQLPAAVLSVDPIENAMLRSGIAREQPTGLAAYMVADAVARHLVALGQSVVIDAVNDVAPARDQWRAIAREHDVVMPVIEVVCSSEPTHRARLAARVRDLPGFSEPTWDDVLRRQAEFEPWAQERLVLDSVDDPERNVARALAYLRSAASASP